MGRAILVAALIWSCIAPAEVAGQRPREGRWAGLTLGYGSFGCTVEVGCDGGFNDGQRAVSLVARLGRIHSPALRVGVDVGFLRRLDDRTATWVGTAIPALTVYPIGHRGLHVRAGAGLSLFRRSGSSTEWHSWRRSEPAIAPSFSTPCFAPCGPDVPDPGPVPSRTESQFSSAAMLGIGYDFPMIGAWALTPMASLVATSPFGTMFDVHRTFWQVGVGVTWR